MYKKGTMISVETESRSGKKQTCDMELMNDVSLGDLIEGFRTIGVEFYWRRFRICVARDWGAWHYIGI